MNSSQRTTGILFLGNFLHSGRTRLIVHNYIRAFEAAGLASTAIDYSTGIFMGAATGHFWRWDRQNKILTSQQDLLVVMNGNFSDREKIQTRGNPHFIGSALFESIEAKENTDRIKNLSGLWVPTASERDAFIQCGLSSEFIKIIPYCLDANFFDPEISPLELPGLRDFVVLTVLSKVHTQDLKIMLKAYCQAFENNSATTLLIKTTDAASLQTGRIKEIIKSEVDPEKPNVPHIEVLEKHINFDRIRQLYQTSHVYLAAGEHGHWDFPAWEAMAMGKCVIAGPEEHNESYLKKTHALVLPATLNMSSTARIDALKNALKKAFSDKDECLQKGRLARNYIVENFSIGSLGNRLRALIPSYIQKKSDPEETNILNFSRLWASSQKSAHSTASSVQSLRDPSLTRNDIKRLKSLHNKFQGNRIFIIGSGPSLNNTPLHLLKNEFTFGVNRIYLLFDRIEWRPTFYSAFDLRVVPDNKDEINALDIDYKFFATKHRAVLGESENKYWYLDNSRKDGLDNRFEPEAVHTGFGGGGSITHLAIQIAFFLGFDPIYLIGVDADYKIPPTVKQTGPDKFGDGTLLYLEGTQDDDPNHFDPRYYGKGKKYHNPNVADMLRGYLDIRLAMEKRGRQIYNATVGGKLYIFERVDFPSLFK